MYKKLEKEVKSYHENEENTYLAMKTPKASGALRRAPDPMPRYAHFTRLTPLRYVGKIGQTRAGAPLDQILDPLLRRDYPVYLITYKQVLS